MSDYAQAINQALKQNAEHLRDYGGFLAQAGLTIAQAERSLSFDEWKLVEEGYQRQLTDFPNG